MAWRKWIRPELVSLPRPTCLERRGKALETGAVDFASSTPVAGRLSEYPHGEARRLRDALSRFNESYFLSPIAPQGILPTRGASEGIELCLRAAARPGDAVVYAAPTFFMYQHWAAVSGLKTLEVPIGAGHTLPVEALVATGARLAIVCQPNSPTGKAFSVEDLDLLAGGFAGLVVVDETYVEFCPENSVSLLLARHRNLVVVRSFSKAWGLAAVRGGYVLAHPELVEILRLVQGPFGTSIVVEEVLLEALKAPALLRERVLSVCHERERVRRVLAELPGVENVLESETSFLAFVAPKGQAWAQRLEDQGFLVNACPELAPGALRMGIRTPEENNRLLKALTEIAQS